METGTQFWKRGFCSVDVLITEDAETGEQLAQLTYRAQGRITVEEEAFADEYAKELTDAGWTLVASSF